MSQSQNNLAGIADMLGGAVKQSPEALLLLAAGCALLMRSRPASGPRNRLHDTGAGGGSARAGASVHQYTSDVADRARDYTSDAADRVRDYASDVTDTARETLGSYASAASNYADQARRTIGDQSHQAFQQTQSALQGTFDRVLKDQPLVVAFAGLAVGAALAASFPTTDAEKETLGPLGERVSDAAVKVGERLKDAASEATDTVKQSAERRGLTADGLKEMASEVAGAFSGRMTEGAGAAGGEGSRGGASQSSKMPSQTNKMPGT
jgi:ElaB/YqjD/DUF883 family membrane-anchored ribosome-binding protein